MTYELAKELKDAGFPFEVWYTHPDGVTDFKPPTLEELIEAVGDNFRNINHDTPEWQANAFSNATGKNFAYGSTPSEAVARLWLALRSVSSKPSQD